MAIDLDFDSLFSTALSVWPSKIDLRFTTSVRTNPYDYRLTGLEEMLVEIERQCIGAESEIIWRELHIAIYSIIEDAAKFVDTIEIDSLRPDAVRSIFEDNLKLSDASEYDLNWLPEDHILVSDYFAQRNVTAK